MAGQFVGAKLKQEMVVRWDIPRNLEGSKGTTVDQCVQTLTPTSLCKLRLGKKLSGSSGAAKEVLFKAPFQADQKRSVE